MAAPHKNTFRKNVKKMASQLDQVTTGHDRVARNNAEGIQLQGVKNTRALQVRRKNFRIQLLSTQQAAWVENQIRLTGGSGNGCCHPRKLVGGPDVILVAESDEGTTAGADRGEKIACVAETLGIHTKVNWKGSCARKFGHDRCRFIGGAVICNDKFKWRGTLALQRVQLGLQMTLAVKGGKGY
ncbi:MAG: hypothetical protein VKI39_02045 [Synechococcus sp.]|nr:hypothetical protein [Synechococcus sp.]